MATSSKSEIGEARTLKILEALLRFGPLPAHALYALVVSPEGFASATDRKAWEAKMRALEQQKLIARVDAEPEKKTKSGTPSKTKLARLAKAGAELLARHGITDALGTLPEGVRAADFEVPASWKHEALTAGILAQLAAQGCEYITDLELQRACKSSEDKLSDALVRPRGSEAPWVWLEVEFAKKTGGWAERQARVMAQALQDGFMLGERWPVQDCILVTTTRPESPTPEDFARRISAYMREPATLFAVVCDVDEAAKITSIERREIAIEPLLDPERIAITYGELGEEYFAALCESAQQRADAARRGEFVEKLPEKLTIASWKLGDYSGEIYISRPIEQSFGTYHWITLCYGGEPMLKDICVGGVDRIIPAVKDCIIAAVQWGDTDEEIHAERTIASLVADQRAAMLRHLPELAHWVHVDGRSLEEIAQAWQKAHAEFIAEHDAHVARMRALGHVKSG